MMIRNDLVAGALTLALAPAATAGTVVDDFEGGTNAGGWYYNGGEVIETTGGNPGGWLHNDFIDNFAPIFNSAWNVPDFTGNFRSADVTGFSFDARLSGYSTSINMSILLRDTNGTPGFVDDDDYAYFAGPNIPPGDGTWVHYDFPIPSQDMSPVPAGWSGGWVGDLEHFRPGVDWNDVITSVDRVEIWFWHPAYFGIFTFWDAGLDNVSITSNGAVSVERSSWGAIKGLYR